MAKIEFRMQDAHMSSSGDMVVSGYVNETEQFSHELGMAKRFKEKISKGAFKRAIANSKKDIDFLAEHDSSVVLASTKNNTLQLKEDETGLYMEARIINTSAGRDWYEMISSGLITNMSFGFRSVADEWKSVGENLFERTINDLELFEVSAVRNPAYASSSISNRGLNSLDDDIVPDNIEEDSTMEQRTADALIQAFRELTNEVKELRGTLGQNKDGEQVNVQKDNYAVGQQTSAQASSEDDFKRIKKGESLGKYAGDKNIDDKGSYNHDKNVPQTDKSGKVVNEPESQSGKTEQYDGSHPDEVPGAQNHESTEDSSTDHGDSSDSDSSDSDSPDGDSYDSGSHSEEEGEEDGYGGDDYSSRSISYEEFERQMRELRDGGNY